MSFYVLAGQFALSGVSLGRTYDLKNQSELEKKMRK